MTFYRAVEDMTCDLCEQPVENCGRHSNRRAVSFDTLMVPGFQHGVVSIFSKDLRNFIQHYGNCFIQIAQYSS